MQFTSQVVIHRDNPESRRVAETNDKLRGQSDFHVVPMVVGFILLLFDVVKLTGLKANVPSDLAFGLIYLAMFVYGAQRFARIELNSSAVRRAVVQGNAHFIPAYVHQMWVGIVQANAQAIKDAKLDMPIWRDVCDRYIGPADASQLVRLNEIRITPQLELTTVQAASAEIRVILDRLFREVMRYEQYRQVDTISEREATNQRLREEIEQTRDLRQPELE